MGKIRTKYWTYVNEHPGEDPLVMWQWIPQYRQLCAEYLSFIHKNQTRLEDPDRLFFGAYTSIIDRYFCFLVGKPSDSSKC